MGSRSGTECGGKVHKSKKEDNLKCCFLVTVGSNGQIDISPQKYPYSDNPSVDAKALKEKIRDGNLLKGASKKSKAQSRKHNLNFSLLKSEQKRLNSLLNRKADEKKISEKEQMDAIKESFAGIKPSGILRDFVKICNNDLSKNQFERTEPPDTVPAPKNPLKEEVSPPKETLPVKDSSSMVKNVPSLRKLSEKTAAQVRHRLQKMASMVNNSRYEGGNNAENATAQLQQQQQQHAANGNTQPHVTISFIPMSQRQAPSASATTVMCPCQQFLDAPPSNLSSCCSCTCSNCCPSRPPPYRPMPPAASKCNQCGFLGPPVPTQDASHSCPCSTCSLLRPTLFSSCSCNSCPFYTAPNLQSAQSLGFMSSGNHLGQQMYPSILTPSPYAGLAQTQQQSLPVGSVYYPGINHCLHPSMQPNYNQCAHCRMHLHHHPYCHCGSYYNGQKQYQQQQPIPPPRKAKPLKTQDAADGMKSIFTKLPQDLEQGQPTEFNNKKLSKDMVRESGGGTNKSDPNSLYAARFGRTCLILRPTSTAMMPRLLTKRISRYTSVVAWPTSTPKIK
ncbi:uncharacterized protein Dana_GF23609 [Drosophila ananassae]|uniref:Uncharacterized protein n=1 Tax=Drosophila ananassae TaxID=7217 RepID=B3M8S0_DROAN|nr:uncharacterized protein LOC6506250 [Drosophila ananassae]EDV41071.2 uncharacterized protein Dana_GF23609 [Drosophila ananassae]